MIGRKAAYRPPNEPQVPLRFEESKARWKCETLGELLTAALDDKRFDESSATHPRVFFFSLFFFLLNFPSVFFLERNTVLRRRRSRTCAPSWAP